MATRKPWITRNGQIFIFHTLQAAFGAFPLYWMLGHMITPPSCIFLHLVNHQIWSQLSTCTKQNLWLWHLASLFGRARHLNYIISYHLLTDAYIKSISYLQIRHSFVCFVAKHMQHISLLVFYFIIQKCLQQHQPQPCQDVLAELQLCRDLNKRVMPQ